MLGADWEGELKWNGGKSVGANHHSPDDGATCGVSSNWKIVTGLMERRQCEAIVPDDFLTDGHYSATYNATYPQNCAEAEYRIKVPARA